MLSTSKSPNTKRGKADCGLWAVIAAAGAGRRYGSHAPKQFCEIGGATPIRRAVELVLQLEELDGVVCVIPLESTGRYETVLAGISDGRLIAPVFGGHTRSVSVLNGLQAIEQYNPRFVLIHDAARCFCSKDVLDAVVNAVTKDGARAVVPAIRPVDAVRMYLGDSAGIQRCSVPKENVRLVQTPQGFCFKTIYELYKKHSGLTFEDDASLCDMDGVEVTIVDGDPGNIKITYSADTTKASSFRTGFGYDVHKFSMNPSRVLRLMGEIIPEHAGLDGISDADVGIHSLVDAILGALGAGSIGEHFPEDDVRFEGAESALFLEHCKELLKQADAYIVNIDTTIVCETPKIAVHSHRMRENIAISLGIAESSVNIKGKTTEGLGFEGRGEGISAYTTVMIGMIHK
ncbi:MAG: 2-C-methyl-D-erythritol 2,4-cyclodiphosphate synthase [Holosporales bacterium]|jgi:2-C-methyl-D-erythritol 4-phosphate cytidylyltransferase/2-C-methyl-D-erythritol 2,4-cyclodiphosphate synthase|nr:2-C-methyl-D-erythritol 2,4-cyclodiphosphate synthase [Holosporales bacterium]